MVHRLDELTLKAEATADKVAAAGETAELEASLGRLRISLAQLTVLRNALAETENAVDRVAAYVPRT
jgi:hypothetical protein